MKVAVHTSTTSSKMNSMQDVCKKYTTSMLNWAKVSLPILSTLKLDLI